MKAYRKKFGCYFIRNKAQKYMTPLRFISLGVFRVATFSCRQNNCKIDVIVDKIIRLIFVFFAFQLNVQILLKIITNISLFMFRA